MKGAVSIIIGTYGPEDVWDGIAAQAIESAQNQSHPVEVVRSHGDTLQEARNFGAEEAMGEWLIFLDADDELDPGYVTAMLDGTGDIRQPSTLGIVDGQPDDFPVLIPRRNLLDANFLVIGCMVQRSRFLDSGGFDDYPILEDWALWLKLWVDGAEIGTAPEAIYKVHVSQNGRNNHDPTLHGYYYTAIHQRFSIEANERGRTWT